jgi:hypothetical protein
MLRKEFGYYASHQNELVEKYKGKYLVIKNEKVIHSQDKKLYATYRTPEYGRDRQCHY